MFTRYQNLKDKEDGFTLVELLIVVVIIGILAAIAIPIYLNQQKAALQAGVKADVKALQIAVQTYLVKNPEATNLGLRQNGYGTPTGSLASDTKFREILGYNWTPSDPSTIMVIREDSAYSATAPDGSWKKYVVLGSNNAISLDDGSTFIFKYTSETGKYQASN